MKASLILGIPCTLRHPRCRRIVARVLRQIRERFPRDFARLLARVRLIRPLPRSKHVRAEGGMLALTPAHDGTGRLETLCVAFASCWDDIAEAVVELKETKRTTDLYFTQLAAHELGHACTRGIDIERRNAPDMEWGSEAAADWYVWRWGFGVMPHTAIGHHGASPGQTIEESGAGIFEMSRNFVYRRIGDSTLTVDDIIGQDEKPQP